MKNLSPLKLFILFCVLIGSVVLLSNVTNKLWGGKPETIPAAKELVIVEDMTVEQFGQQNNIPNPVMKEILGLQNKSDLQKQLDDFGLSHEQIKIKFDKSLTLKAEHESKNWFKIPLKFGLWLAFLGVVFTLMRKNRINSRTRKIFYLTAVILFGIILGADPSPMGTVKDAIHLYGAKKVIFPPRMIALSILLLSLFVYRPWCQMFCPFGLVGWLVEKTSLFKVKVDYDSCISCEACAKACPSTVMNAILKRTNVIPDCFACGTCINICPTDSIRFQVGKRQLPPKDKFKDTGNEIKFSR